MDHYSILDQSSAAGAEKLPGGSVSAAIAAVNAANGPVVTEASHSGFRLPSEDGGQSLAHMAESDLDAALQLLSERAQYITGASGAAIALRRPQHNDMLCRASAGSNAPELGALLSAEFGLSGESVRTRQALRCDDAERDPRVNREGCRQLGIASVVVLPIVSDDQVLGVFELFSGSVNAFEERDILALQRLGEMVETAVKLAHAAATLPEEIAEPGQGETAEETPVEVEVAESEAASVVEVPVIAPAAAQGIAAQTAATAEVATKPAAAKKPLLWSAALQTSEGAQKPEADQSHVPPMLRNLKKCHACGFPVSEGRMLCVECEEKKWKGQLRSSMVAGSSPAPGPKAASAVPAAPEKTISLSSASLPSAAAGTAVAAAKPPVKAVEPVVPSPVAVAPAVGAPVVSAPTPALPLPLPPVVQVSALPAPEPATVPEPSPAVAESTALPVFSTGLGGGSESWLSANKYILGALLVVAGVVGAVAFLR